MITILSFFVKVHTHAQYFSLQNAIYIFSSSNDLSIQNFGSRNVTKPPNFQLYKAINVQNIILPNYQHVLYIVFLSGWFCNCLSQGEEELPLVRCMDLFHRLSLLVKGYRKEC